MRGAKLPNIGLISVGLDVRIDMAKAISELEVYAKRSSTLPPGVAQFQTFLDACDTALTNIKAYPASIVASATDVALSLASDQTEQIVVTKTPLSGSTSNVAATSNYTSSNVAVLTVSATGLVTAVGAGSATVTAKNGNKTSNALAFTVGA